MTDMVYTARLRHLLRRESYTHHPTIFDSRLTFATRNIGELRVLADAGWIEVDTLQGHWWRVTQFLPLPNRSGRLQSGSIRGCLTQAPGAFEVGDQVPERALGACIPDPECIPQPGVAVQQERLRLGVVS